MLIANEICTRLCYLNKPFYFNSKNDDMKIFYRPAKIYILIDFLVLILSFYVVLDWFPLTTNNPFEKYSWSSLCYLLTWAVISYFLKRYKPLKRQKYFRTTFKLFYTTLIIFGFFYTLIYLFFGEFSIPVLFSITTIAFLLNYLVLSFYFAYRYAVQINEYIQPHDEGRINAKVKPAVPLDDESYNKLCSTIQSHSGDKVLKFLCENDSIDCGNTYVFASTDIRILEYQLQYQFSTIIQLERLNNILGINRMLSIANEKLPDDGIFVCCFETKSTYKKVLLKRYIQGLNYVVYALDYIFRRVFPKIFITRKLFYLITGGRNRILSKAEVLGRLYCCGYEVILEKKINYLTYVFARRIKHPELIQKRTYGPLIRLRRYGKNGEPFEVYKMRTMHPYSEYLQGYIYELNNLQEGGKFKKDIRVTTLGKFMRKYWLDEFPMIINLFKGEMKLVGVRPLSAHYFSLYTKELQKKRIKFKPGLLPPYYADMPRTIDEIQASELRYLKACETKGVFFTDIRYLFLILGNILFRKAHSA